MSTHNQDLSPARKLSKLVWAVLAVASIGLFAYSCMRAWLIPMTFDEVWSLNSYASSPWLDILTFKQVSANNHVGNSLLMKVCLLAFGNHPFSLRLPNLFAHAIFLIYSIALARRFRQGVWVLMAFAFFNFHPYMLDFFSLARGYGLSLAMVMAALYHLFAFRENAFTRHLIWNVIFASLSVLFNFSSLHFFLADITVLSLLIYSHSHAWDEDWKLALRTALMRFAPIAIASTLLLLYMRSPVKLLIANKQLYYGGNTGFWTDTVSSLAHSGLYRYDYHKYDVEGLKIFVLASLVAMFITFAIELSERQNRLRESAGTLAFLLLLIPAVVGTLQHFLLDSPFLIYRTALLFVPIYSLALIWLLRTIAKVPELRKPIAVISSVLTLVLLLHNAKMLNLRSSSEWFSDCDTPQVLQDLAADRAAQGLEGNTKLSVCWQLRPVVNYHKDQLGFDWMPEVKNDGCPPGANYYFIFEGGDGCKLPKEQLPFGEKQGCTLIKSYPESHTSLWRGPKP